MKYRPARRPDNKGADNTALPVISRIGDEQSLSQFSCPCQFDSLFAGDAVDVYSDNAD